MKHTHNHQGNCRDLLGQLSDYVDGVLQDELCMELERHISECKNCQIVVDTMKKTIYLYHSTSSNGEIPAGVRSRLFSSLNLEEFLKPE
ncbi:MAG: zf-HC2 domain-containing protein [Anaerolineales bacterium]|nr:zf-HC2 domain-containing protein [Anaerolineales bacterium]